MENNISYQINRLSLAHTRLHRMANIISAQEGEGMELRISMKWDETQNIKFILKCVCGERGGASTSFCSFCTDYVESGKGESKF